MDADLRSSSVGQVALRAVDVPRATAFYRDTLGLPFLFAFPGLAFFQAGEVRLMLSGAEKPEFDHPASILYYKVADIVASHRTLAARGVEFIDEPHLVHRAETHELWLTFFKDSEGNHAALMSERPLG